MLLYSPKPCLRERKLDTHFLLSLLHFKHIQDKRKGKELLPNHKSDKVGNECILQWSLYGCDYPSISPFPAVYYASILLRQARKVQKKYWYIPWQKTISSLLESTSICFCLTCFALQGGSVVFLLSICFYH